jgi:hypothetical protein
VTALRLVHLPEPTVEFGDGESSVIREGLAALGPYSLRLGAAHPSAVRVGIVGTPASVVGARKFLERMAGRIHSGRPNALLTPDYPGFAASFRSSLAVDSRWVVELDPPAVDRALARPPYQAFEACLGLWVEGVRGLIRDIAPDVVLCALPADVLDRCRVVNVPRPKGSSRGRRRGRRTRKDGSEQLELNLFDAGAGSIEGASQPQTSDLRSRNFRRALKAAAMDVRVPIQIVTPSLYEEGGKQQDPATRAWNLSVALFYKAGGLPWRARAEVEHTCFVGISFHHLFTADRHVMFSSLAQAFSTEGDGFALRGGEIPWDPTDRRPHLDEAQSEELLGKVMTAYRSHVGRDPLRVVVHKTSEFTTGERQGMKRALADVPAVEMQTVRSTDFRLLRQGTYPPHRGTLAIFGDASFLFSTGYSDARETYEGPHVPVPLELVDAAGTAAELSARELLSLSKMNWNSARDHIAFPISLAFARQVGLVMAEIPRDADPHPLYRFYM